MKWNLSKKIALGALATVVFIGTYIVVNSIEESKMEYVANETMVITKNEGNVGKVDNKLEDMSTTQIVHEMANTIIIAKDEEIWGKIDPSPANLDYVIERLEKESYQNPQLINTLKQWRKGTFSNVVWVHNHMWDALGGTVGEAERTKDSAIIKLLQKYDYSK